MLFLLQLGALLFLSILCVCEHHDVSHYVLCVCAAARWRTALVIRELEREIDSLALGRPHRDRLKELMNKKELVGGVTPHMSTAHSATCRLYADCHTPSTQGTYTCKCAEEERGVLAVGVRGWCVGHSSTLHDQVACCPITSRRLVPAACKPHTHLGA